MVTTTHRVEEGGIIKEVSITRPRADRTGRFAERQERVITVDKPEVEPPKETKGDKGDKETVIITPDSHPEEFRSGLIIINAGSGEKGSGRTSRRRPRG